MLTQNEPSFNKAVEELRASHPSAPLITFSHFLPRIELNPEKRYLLPPTLAKAVGSNALRARVDALQPDCHVFGVKRPIP